MKRHTSLFLLISLLSSSLLWAQPRFSVIPEPVSVQAGQGAFVLSAGSDISVPQSNAEVSGIATYLAGRIKPATGFDLKVVAASRGIIQLDLLVRQDTRLGQEGYLLDVTSNGIVIRANAAAGIF